MSKENKKSKVIDYDKFKDQIDDFFSFVTKDSRPPEFLKQFLQHVKLNEK